MSTLNAKIRSLLLVHLPAHWTLTLFCALAVPTQSLEAAANDRLTNGSFEIGDSAPKGWQLHTGALWTNDVTHTGKRSLVGVSKTAQIICESDPISLRAGAEYRLEGWINCISGRAQLGVDILDEKRRIRSEELMPVSRSKTWRYVAFELRAPAPPSEDQKSTFKARVWFRVKGEACLDDVAFVPIALSFMGNRGLEADERGRIGFWQEEKEDRLLPGRRAGEIRPDKDVKREGKSSALLICSADWLGLSSINYGLSPATDRYELSAWARCERASSALILACWTDAEQKVLRVDPSPSIQSNDWEHLVLSLTAPSNASAVRLVAVARGSRVWFDDCDLVRLRPGEPRVRVFVNQVGYEQHGPKSLVIAGNMFPSNDFASFELVTPTGKTVWKHEARCSGRIYGGTPDDWGWYFWRGDFSSAEVAGEFRARTQLSNVQGESVPFKIGRDEILKQTAQSAVDFFFIQRCGFDVPGWHKACHLDDAKLPDGSHIDATGGWHSAGDYNKLMYEHGDGGVVFALLKAFRAAPETFRHFDRNHDGLPDALEEAIWGAQFVAKMQVLETGGLRNNVSQGPGRQWTKWSAPEVHTDNIVGTPDDPVVQSGEGNSPLVIGAWARLSMLLRERGRTNDYLNAAVRLWEHATKGGTNAGSPYLLLSSLELYAVTQEISYLDYARRTAESLFTQQTKAGGLEGAFGNYGEAAAAGLASFALACKNEPLNSRILEALKKYILFCQRQADNPFGLSRQIAGETNQFFPADLGHNFVILHRAWAAALIYRLTHDPAALVFAVDQMDWVLGKNPLDICLFEGKGAFNPPRYHHRYNQIPGHERGAVPGTIPNGFVRELGMADRPGLDMSRGGSRAPSFRTSEPWLVHNLFYLLAASELHLALQR